LCSSVVVFEWLFCPPWRPDCGLVIKLHTRPQCPQRHQRLCDVLPARRQSQYEAHKEGHRSLRRRPCSPALPRRRSESLEAKKRELRCNARWWKGKASALRTPHLAGILGNQYFMSKKSCLHPNLKSPIWSMFCMCFVIFHKFDSGVFFLEKHKFILFYVSFEGVCIVIFFLLLTGMQNQSMWSTGLFDCCADVPMCCFTIFLPCFAFGRNAEALDGEKNCGGRSSTPLHWGACIRRLIVGSCAPSTTSRKAPCLTP
jgi:hypothetical protein